MENNNENLKISNSENSSFFEQKVSSSNGNEGYPKLRFFEYKTPYELKKIGDVYSERSERGNGNLQLLSVTMNDGVKLRSELDGKDNSSEDKSSYKKVDIGDMVYNSMRMWQGANGISNFEGIVSPAYTVLKAKTNINNNYFAKLFKNTRLINEFRKNSQGLTSDTWNLKYPQIAPIKIMIPNIEEQNKIAEFFSLIDQRIEKQRQLVESLKKYKRGLFNKIFSSFVGEYITLENILVEVNEKSKINNEYPIISSTKQGLFLQSDYFNKQAASENTIGYKILRKGQIVFSPQNLWMGNINYNSNFEIGIVSPSYKIYQINKKFNPYFIGVLLKEPIALKEYMLASEQGASIVRRNLNLELFNNIKFKIPTLEIQDKLAVILKTAITIIDKEELYLSMLNKYKNGLLQQMFI